MRLRVLPALLALLALPVRAQAPPLVAWEQVGELPPFRAVALAFRHGAPPDGSADTLYAALDDPHLYRYDAAADAWVSACRFCAPFDIAVTKEGYLLLGAPSGITRADRSTDGGRTWEEDVYGGAECFYQSTLPTLGGAVYLCLGPAVRSLGGGAAGTWEPLGSMGGSAAAFAEVPPSAPLPEGRLLGGAWNGAAYSGDGGLTWTPSSLWADGRYVVNDLAFAPDPAHAYGGVAYAAVAGGGDPPGYGPAVFRSGDGGATWARVVAFPPGAYGFESLDWAVVEVGPGGAVWVGVQDILGGTQPYVGTVVRSLDGGQTWGEAVAGFPRWAVRDMAFGRDGRLYLAADRGVWRTTTPVVASEPVREGDTGLALSAAPNPATGAVRVALSSPLASDVRVAAYDVLGREVAVLHAGPLGAGVHALAFDTSALPPGLYIVRAVGQGWTAATRLVVAR